MKNILILDTETTGLHPHLGAKVIEIGAQLFNVKHKVVLQNISTLIETDINPVMDINKIDPEWTQYSVGHELIIKTIENMADNSDAIIAHNAEFDIKFMKTVKLNETFWHKKWICTRNDFKWPVELFRKRLEDICNAMGVQYIDAHRALADCNLLSECLSRVDNLEQRLISATRKEKAMGYHGG